VTSVAGKCESARVVVGGMVPTPLRASSVESALLGQELSAENIAKASSLVSKDLGSDILGDIFASEQYRRAVAPVWVKRALMQAAGQVQ
jgi:carbon-monoxide dehydrogenase medium subunit